MRVFRGVGVFMCALFVFAAVLQYNDPDPLQWMAIYLSAAAVSALDFVGRLRWYFAAIIGSVALVWAGVLAAEVWGLVRFSELFSAWEMKNPTIEEGREMYGLFIIAGWMALLLVAIFRRRSSVHPGGKAAPGEI